MLKLFDQKSVFPLWRVIAGLRWPVAGVHIAGLQGNERRRPSVECCKEEMAEQCGGTWGWRKSHPCCKVTATPCGLSRSEDRLLRSWIMSVFFCSVSRAFPLPAQN